jgi:hypothetical protein
MLPCAIRLQATGVECAHGQPHIATAAGCCFKECPTMFEKTLPRRSVLKGALAALAAIPVVAVSTRANAAGAKIDPNDAKDPAHGQVVALGYMTASKTAGQTCANCVQYQGKAGDASGACNIFGGRPVDSGGWCKVWAKKP